MPIDAGGVSPAVGEFGWRAKTFGKPSDTHGIASRSHPSFADSGLGAASLAIIAGLDVCAVSCWLCARDVVSDDAGGDGLSSSVSAAGSAGRESCRRGCRL